MSVAISVITKHEISKEGQGNLTILAILQNAWFKNPDSAERIFAKYPDKRNSLIAQFLFMGCLTGRRLQKAFGAELCELIIWEEAHPRCGGHSASKFGFDAEHIKSAIEKHEPNIVLAFGKIAGDGLLAATRLISVSERPVRFYASFGPHPASRQPDILQVLRGMAEDLEKRIKAT